MTEDEWLTSLSPVAMLHHLNADGYARKPLLYAVAVCEREPELLTEVLSAWVESVKQFVAGQVGTRFLDNASLGAEDEAEYLAARSHGGPKAQYAAITNVICCTWITAEVEYELDYPVPPDELEPVQRANADLVRDIFGNPFRPITFASAWRTSTAIAIAKQMYESRDFSATPILADALQDAGCDNEGVLRHCRDPQQVHVRGCWVVDLVLGYE